MDARFKTATMIKNKGSVKKRPLNTIVEGRGDPATFQLLDFLALLFNQQIDHTPPTPPNWLYFVKKHILF